MAFRSLLFATGFAALAACTAIPAEGTDNGGMDNAPTQADGKAFTMSPGQQVTLADNSHLRYVRVVNDSRCAPDVQCVWAGDAILAFEWKPATGTTDAFELHTGLEPRSHAIGSRKLTLQSLSRDPQPVATLQVDGGG